MPRALIIGSEGQDGTLLKALLSTQGYFVCGLGQSAQQRSKGASTYFQYDLSIGDYNTLRNLVLEQRPDEIYFVAAHHHSSQQSGSGSLESIERSINVNQSSFIRLLEICRSDLPTVKIIYTSSSLIFSGCGVPIQNEQTVHEPRCIYSVTKCAAMDAAKYYRGTHGLFVSVGIMYNHESIYRKDHYLSKKIILDTKKYLNGEIPRVTVGDLSAVTDWGYAPDYVQALWHILQLQDPDVFIVSSGVGRQVQDWIAVLYHHLKLDWIKIVVEDPSLISRNKPVLIGDNTKLRGTGWEPKVSFEEMVIKLYENVV